jgi:hypothetical protein
MENSGSPSPSFSGEQERYDNDDDDDDDDDDGVAARTGEIARRIDARGLPMGRMMTRATTTTTTPMKIPSALGRGRRGRDSGG